MKPGARLLVTGATGALGGAVIRHLIARGVAVGAIAALARDSADAADLAALGIDVRRADYADAAAMRTALTGIDRLLLISATAFSDAAALHAQVIDAARDAGVGRVVYTAIQNEAAGGFEIEQVGAWDRETERALTASGLGVTIVRHSLYADSIPFIIGGQSDGDTVRAPAGTGRAAIVLRDDLAEANAALLLLDAPEAEYTLTGPEAVSMDAIAAAAGRGLGRVVEYRPVSREDFVPLRAAEGLPSRAAVFMSSWFEAIAAGAFPARGDIAALLGRPARSALAWIEAHYREHRPADGDDDARTAPASSSSLQGS